MLMKYKVKKKQLKESMKQELLFENQKQEKTEHKFKDKGRHSEKS